MKLWALVTIFALMFIVIVFAFGLAINSCVKEVKEIGLKNIVEEVWEGEK